MLKIKREGVILKPTKLSFEDQSVLNPGVFQDGKSIHMVYRAINKKDMTSCLGYARLEGPTKVVERWDHPYMSPQYKYERKGLEDARITKLKDDLFMTYVVHDGKHALIAYSSGKDLMHMDRGGVISPRITYSRAGKLFRYSKLKDDYYFFESFYKNYGGKNIFVWEKDGILFPEKIKGRYALLHRILPDIQIIYFKDFGELQDTMLWTEYMMHLSKYVVMEGQHGFEQRHIGGGAPPIKTDKGWLLIYHATEENNNGRIYHAGAALLDLKNPQKVLARLPYPLISPEHDAEKKGFVNNVVFPTGTAIFNGRLYIYYGAADTYISAASVNLNELLKELSKNKIKE